MIKVSGLHKTYPVQHGDVHEVRAVNGISFDIPTGSFFSLLGPSGCGKSTTLRCVAGLERPEAGEIIIGDQVVFSSEKKIFVLPNKREVGMVYQSYAIWPHMNVYDNVAFPLQVRWKKQPAKEIREKVREGLRMCGLEGFEERPAQVRVPTPHPSQAKADPSSPPRWSPPQSFYRRKRTPPQWRLLR